MPELFDKNSIRECHHQRINAILDQGGGVEEIVNYLMSRIGNVIAYERRKYERRLIAQWSKNNGQFQGESGERESQKQQ